MLGRIMIGRPGYKNKIGVTLEDQDPIANSQAEISKALPIKIKFFDSPSISFLLLIYFLKSHDLHFKSCFPLCNVSSLLPPPLTAYAHLGFQSLRFKP